MATKKTKKKARRPAPESRLAEARLERAAVQVLAGMSAGFGLTSFANSKAYEEARDTLVARAIDLAEELIDQLDGEDEDDELDEDEDDDDRDD